MISIEQIRERRSERKTLTEQAGELLGKAPEGGLAGDDLAKFEALHERADELKKQIDALERQYEAEQADVRHAHQTADPRELDKRLEAAEKKAEKREKGPDEQEAEYRDVFFKYLELGEARLNDHERGVLESRAAWQTNPDAQGGYAVPATTYEQIELYTKQMNGLERAGAQVLTVQANGKFEVPVIDDSAETGNLGGEGNPANQETTPAMGVADLTDYRFDSDGVVLSRQFWNSSVDNIESVLAEMLGSRIGQAMQRYFTVGTGTAEPQGIVTGSGTVPAAGATAITYKDVIDLIYSVPQRYRADVQGRVGFSCAALTIAALRNIVDNEGRPIFVSGNTSLNQPDTLLGYPITENDDVPAIGTGNKSLVFANHSKYMIKKVGMTRVYSDPYTLLQNEQIQYYGFHDAGGALVNTEASKVLLHP